ncbi:MAG: AAA domain (dynein-related subfamily) [Candidatus Bathyarchaeota archaeon BA2]|nr:MAG: AAA domain (dynein-related subfamily) [Candidatus Bathyarchaeota archaeon BA2]
MKYVPTHKRVVRGKRIHETVEERHSKLELEKRTPELSIERVEAEFLVPTIEIFVETEQVRRLKDRVKLWIKVGYPPHIVGPTGCGKTTLAMQVARELGRPTVWINGDEQMTTTDLIGGYSEMEAESVRDRFVHNVMLAKDRTKFTWVDNPLTLACKYGYTLVYNEFSRAKPEANNVLLSVLEENILELPTMFGDERYIKVHPDFTAIFTSNSIEYAGVHKPQDALLDRMVDIYMDYYDFDTEVKIVQAHTGMPLQEAKKVVKAVRILREKLPEPHKPGTRAEIMICQGLNAMDGYSKEDLEQIYMDILATKIGEPKELLKKGGLIREILSETYGDA